MSHKVDLCNRALCVMGHGVSINSLDEESAEARVFRMIYGATLREVLRAHSWNFATSYQRLPLLVDFEEGNLQEKGCVIVCWRYGYALPMDVIRVLEIVKEEYEDDIPFEVVSKVGDHKPYQAFTGKSGVMLLTHKESPTIKYISAIENEDVFDALFEEAFVLKLALSVSETISQDHTLREILERRYQDKIMQAKSMDNNEYFQHKQQTPVWLKGRM